MAYCFCLDDVASFVHAAHDRSWTQRQYTCLDQPAWGQSVMVADPHIPPALQPLKLLLFLSRSVCFLAPDVRQVDADLPSHSLPKPISRRFEHLYLILYMRVLISPHFDWLPV